jgi:hypothetical protein
MLYATETRKAIIALFGKAGITQARKLVFEHLEHEGKKNIPLGCTDHLGPNVNLKWN